MAHWDPGDLSQSSFLSSPIRIQSILTPKFSLSIFHHHLVPLVGRYPIPFDVTIASHLHLDFLTRRVSEIGSWSASRVEFPSGIKLAYLPGDHVVQYGSEGIGLDVETPKMHAAVFPVLAPPAKYFPSPWLSLDRNSRA
jgi:hypothetical protein